MLKNELSESGGRQQKTLYSKLSKDIYRTFLEIRKLNDRKRELELTALSLQLTPHFLFNTLQVIKWKAIALSGGENDASLMIGDLSSLLGYVLGDRKLFTTLDEEIAATKAYIAIQGRRFNDEFTAVWNIGEGVDGGILIPKMILQPLVENAISHGIREAGRPGRLLISIFINRGRELKVRIIDNGKGIIVMVPEISLTPQFVSNFSRRFGDQIAVFHSALSLGERLDEYKRVKNGSAKIRVPRRNLLDFPGQRHYFKRIVPERVPRGDQHDPASAVYHLIRKEPERSGFFRLPEGSFLFPLRIQSEERTASPPHGNTSVEIRKKTSSHLPRITSPCQQRSHNTSQCTCPSI